MSNKVKHYSVVCAVMVNHEGKVYACMRPMNKALPGFYEFPGGKVEIGETKEEAIIREIKEELNLNIKPLKYLGSNTHEYDAYLGFDGFKITLDAYLCQIVSGSLVLNEHQKGDFYTLDELKQLKFAAADVPFISLLGDCLK